MTRTAILLLTLAVIVLYTHEVNADEGECFGPNEVYNSCGSGCGEVTCNSGSTRGRVCPAVCRPGCYCTNGTIRRNRDRACVKRSECKK